MLLQHTVDSDWLFSTQSRVLQADRLILDKMSRQLWMITCPIDVSTIFQTEDRTYSFRRRTMEATIDSTTKKPPVTPAAEGKLKCETLLPFFSLSRIMAFFSIHCDSVVWKSVAYWSINNISAIEFIGDAVNILWGNVELTSLKDLYTNVFMPGKRTTARGSIVGIRIKFQFLSIGSIETPHIGIIWF